MPITFSRGASFIGLYYLAVYAYMYGTAYMILEFAPGLTRSVVPTLTYITVTIVLLSLVAYIIGGRLDCGGFRKCLGFTGANLLKSLVLSSALIALPGMLFGAAAYMGGVDPFEVVLDAAYRYAISGIAPPWFDSVPADLLPPVAVLVWLAAGVLWFGLVQAFPLQCLSRGMGAVAVPIVSAMFILLYNVPLLTNEWKLDDALFLGMAYPAVLYRYRNSLGLVISYVALYEMPVRAAFLVGWGAHALNSVVMSQAVWGAASIAAALLLALRKRM